MRAVKLSIALLFAVLGVALMVAAVRGRPTPEISPGNDFVCSVNGVESFRVDDIDHAEASLSAYRWAITTEGARYYYLQRPGEVCADLRRVK